MTREEAKEILEKYKTESKEDYYVKRADALNMAIKALEQEPRKDEVILTKKEYGELVSSEFDNGYTKGYTEALEQNDVLDKIRAEIKTMSGDVETLSDVLDVVDKYKAERETQ